jgi:hypothetical protein
VIPWDSANNQPLDIGGLAGRIWIVDGSPAPLAPQPVAVTAQAVNAECQRRIYAALSDNAQKNMTANAAAGNLSAADMAAWKEGVAWIAQMQTVCRALVAASDASYADDSHWPPCPTDTVHLAAKY